MGAIFHVNEAELAWSDYRSADGPLAIRYKALTAGAHGVPPVQYLDYGPGQTDPVHCHDVGEFFIVVRGELLVGEEKAGPGGVVFIPPNTDYAVQAGDAGVQYFRVVVA
jgi:hypothetical protein